MSPRVYTRKFDWEEAVRLRAERLPLAEIARRLGVSETAVKHAVDPDTRVRMAVATARYQTSGTCIECGSPCSHRPRVPDRCNHCWADSIATSVREDTLRCTTCREWKPDDDFPFVSASLDARIRRRGRRHHCRACENRARVERRKRNQSRPCETCGTPCYGRDPRHGPGPDLCLACYHATRRAS